MKSHLNADAWQRKKGWENLKIVNPFARRKSILETEDNACVHHRKLVKTLLLKRKCLKNWPMELFLDAGSSSMKYWYHFCLRCNFDRESKVFLTIWYIWLSWSQINECVGWPTSSLVPIIHLFFLNKTSSFFFLPPIDYSDFRAEIKKWLQFLAIKYYQSASSMDPSMIIMSGFEMNEWPYGKCCQLKLSSTKLSNPSPDFRNAAMR